jgi:HlyD family secretion protein
MTIFRWFIAIVLMAGVVFYALGSMRPRPTPPTRVQTATVQKRTITRVVSAAGKLEPRRKVNVSANITGTLVDLQVGIGSVVKKDQYIGQIETTRYKAVVAQQQAQTNAAGSDVRRAMANVARLKEDEARMLKLVETGAGNRADLDSVRAQLRIAEAEVSTAQSRAQSARAALDEATSSLTWATLRSPIDGTVLATNHRVGERVRGSDFAEDVVVVIGTLDEMDVRIEVGENDVVFIKPGQQATIEIEALPDLVLKGQVIDSGRDAIVKNAGTDNEVTTFPVWVRLSAPPDKVLSGMSSQVSIATESRENVVAVPIQAVTVRAAAPEKPLKEGALGANPTTPEASKLDKVVFVMKDGKVEKRKVTTGLSSDAQVEITSGLKEGEVVVEGPYRTLARQLEDGQTVEVGPPGGGPGPGGRKQ